MVAAAILEIEKSPYLGRGWIDFDIVNGYWLTKLTGQIFVRRIQQSK